MVRFFLKATALLADEKCVWFFLTSSKHFRGQLVFLRNYICWKNSFLYFSIKIKLFFQNQKLQTYFFFAEKYAKMSKWHCIFYFLWILKWKYNCNVYHLVLVVQWSNSKAYLKSKQLKEFQSTWKLWSQCGEFAVTGK